MLEIATIFLKKYHFMFTYILYLENAISYI